MPSAREPSFGLPFDAAFLLSCFAKSFKPYFEKKELRFEKLCDALLGQLRHKFGRFVFDNKFFNDNSLNGYVKFQPTSKKNSGLDPEALKCLELAIEKD